MHTQRTFAPEEASVAEARRFVRSALEDWGVEDVSDGAVLATSELVTNAVVHAGTSVRVALDLDARYLRLEVQDLHPHRQLPLGLDGADEGAEHGRGLLITASLAGSWGVEYSTGAKRVWVRFDRSGAVTTTALRVDPAIASAIATATGTATGTAAAVAVVELSDDGEIRTWNADAERMFGWETEAVLGRSWLQIVEPVELVEDGDGGGRSTARAWDDPRWQGSCVVQPRSGGPVDAFASRVSGPPGRGAVLLLVHRARRELLEWPARAPTAPVVRDPLGLREDALTRLGFEAYLDLVVERARDQLGARAAYLLLVRDLESDFEVTTLSGLDTALRGTRLAVGSVGIPDVRNPHLPVVLADFDGSAATWMRNEALRSLVVVPVVAEGRVIGALGVASERPAGFSHEQAVLLQRIGTTAAPAVDRARLRASERERRGWLTLLAESSDLLAGSLDQEMTMAITGQIVVPRLASWCAVYLDDARGRPVLQQVWHRDERAVPALRARLEPTGPGQVRDPQLEQQRDAPLHIPLVTRGRRIGALTLGRDDGDALHGEARVVAESVARRAALAIDNARVHGELQAVGDALQRSLLPSSIPATHVFDVGVVYQAAGDGALAGGDFYDLFPVGAGRWCFAVGDVCGTGAEAAAVTGLARHTIRALAAAGFPVDSILERLNTAILEEGERSRFLTVVCGTMENDGGRIRLGMVSAGHPLPFVVRRAGTVEQIGRPQSLLGVMEHVAFLIDEHVLLEGDLLVIVTDGVLERRDGQRMLSEEGLMAQLSEVGDLPAQAVAERIHHLVASFAHTPQTDDMAVLAIRVAPPRGKP